MKNLTIQRNMVVMTEAEFNRLVSELKLYEDSSVIADQRVKTVEQILKASQEKTKDLVERVKLLEETLRNTENELKELRHKHAADELTQEAQKLGLYGSDFIG